MTVFSISSLDTWHREYEYIGRGGETVISHVPEFPIRIYLRWMRTTDDPDTFHLKIDFAVTDFGEEITSRNAPDARQWIEDNFATYPTTLDNSRVRDLQQICEYVQTGRSGPISFDIEGGTFTVDSEEQITVGGESRTLVNATITTPDVLTITIEDAIEATIDTTEIR